MSYLFRRFAEPSTWAGVALIASHAAQAWATKDPAQLAAVFGGVAAVLAPEKSPA